MYINNDYEKDERKNLINIHKEVCANKYFRKEIWTGEFLQITVMCIPPNGEIGLEMHDDLDQFIRIESGVATVFMGKTKQDVSFLGEANPNYAVMIPANTWHNIINQQDVPLKVYSIYAPPNHPIGTIHKTKQDSDLAE
ncbi:MAG: cupin domain-containing protein [Clostridia bacterium]|nr:cupin domain-containing protein [Clostridia bacterium]